LNNDNITTLKGIGEKTAKLFSSLGVETISDLVGFYPARFLPYPEISAIAELKRDATVAVSGVVMSSPRTIRAGKLKITSITVEDYSGKLKCVWYNSPFVANGIKTDETYVFIGRYSIRKNGAALEHPAIYKYDDYVELQGKLQAIYHQTKGLGQKTIISAVKEAVSKYAFEQDWLPVDMRSKYDLMEEEDAIRMMHYASSIEEVASARKRLAFGEFFSFLYTIRKLKDDDRKTKSDYVIKGDNLIDEFEKVLPYTLTDDQKKAANDILDDIGSGRIMNRLLQGDVGSGKTVVALIAMYAAYKSGYQSAIMVPTEVLANQHYETASRIFEGFDDKPCIVLLTGSMTASEKKKVKDDIVNHRVDIVVGTHALIQEGVEFDELALVITDEQHRFGVNQRHNLSHKGKKPHILVMSATPIPRTLAVILYGDLDVSNIFTKPSNRLPVKNAVITEKDREKAYKHILNEIKAGHQAFIICPMVEESEVIDAENVLDYSAKIRGFFPKDIMIQYIHGRMKQSEKDEIMHHFACGDIDILVSTTVVEVGIDVPNATVIMIENAERYGLATLHQLRGRVGRGSAQSYAIFVRTSDTEIARKRLEVIGSSNDGFYIASEDLRLRGPGEILGSEQSGQLSFEIADIYSDSDILKLAYEACEHADSDSFKVDDDELIRMKKHIEDFKNKTMDNLNI